ncbi:MAG: phospho-N-acetylmuramoyl-pentapeptide-transferase [Trueperaceae bacterium]
MILAATAIVSLLLTGTYVQLAGRRGWGKSVRRDGPSGHLSKEGTPTMGGLAFLAALMLTWLTVGERGPDWAALTVLILGSAALGLWDDISALARKRLLAQGEGAGTGALARWRILLQSSLALGFAIYIVDSGRFLVGVPILDVLGFAFVIVGAVNAFNFADGLDGLAAGMTCIILLLFVGNPLALALMGALLGFLWYNAKPARVFMGGVGSEALGAAVAGLAIVSDVTWYLPLIAVVPVLEVLSVIVQVSYFRLSGGKRIFRMSPLHHHFELTGWSEVQVVMRFWLVTAACVALAYALIRGGA